MEGIDIREEILAEAVVGSRNKAVIPRHFPRPWNSLTPVLEKISVMAMKQIVEALIACSVLAVLLFSSFFVFSHAVSADNLSRVAIGMTEAQVESIIGAPQHVRHEGARGTVFCYGGLQQLKWCSVEIRFGADGRVAGSVFHDH